LCGGAGTRLWPLSREQHPKQLLRLTGERTLLQETVLRLQGIESLVPPLIVCNEEHRYVIAEQLAEIGVTPCAVLLEPVARNTAPALTLAALWVRSRQEDSLLFVLPADHVMTDTEAFHESISTARRLADENRLVTFGVTPTSPETGYGYIRRGEDFAVSGFVEKPDLELAERYVQSGDYYWNSGIFLVRASTWLDEAAQHAAVVVDACQSAMALAKNDAAACRVDRETFETCPSDSIDYAVMEKTTLASVVPLHAGWSDVGAWTALWRVSTADDNGNVNRGDVQSLDNRNSLLIAEHRLLAVIGVSDLVVVETADAVLVTPKDRAQDVKTLVEQLKSQNRNEWRHHRHVPRPWGSFEKIDGGDRFQVKRLVVKPGGSLSYQMHYHRAEHWVVVKGIAWVTRNDEKFLLSENQSTYIPPGAKHRLENPGTIPLEIIEVQSGSYLGEDDIVRLEDRYSRPVTPDSSPATQK
jgi:mannose-1-phosphate guanylyltransferase/mannose-6-phosphate isomerase